MKLRAHLFSRLFVHAKHSTAVLAVFYLLALVLTALAPPAKAQQTAERPSQPSERDADTGPAFLSFDDLRVLSATAKPEGQLADRLQQLLTTPFLRNSTHDVDLTGELQSSSPSPGPILRAAFWNIERGLNFGEIRAALSGPAEFGHVAELRGDLSVRRKRQVDAELRKLQEADVVILNEADVGMKRTDYRNVPRELADALHMNFVYGVEFVEVDPIFDLGTETVHLPNASEDAQLQQDLRTDPARYRGLHGNAILSRYPIQSARILHLPVCHDWYGTEMKGIAQLERAKRWSAHKLFGERIGRELRHGGRMALVADLTVPDSPSGRVTVISVHLENKCPPACRRKQMAALLAAVKQETNPVIVAGDLNTTSKDNTPTSIRNEIMSRVADYRFWVRQAVSSFNPLGIWHYALVPFHFFHGYQDPTAFHGPIFWENRERGLFKDVRNFRFTDGGAFDFSGIAARATGGRQRTLADSNERAFKGFVPTYAFARNYGGVAGNFKLDWFFVKPATGRQGSRSDTNFFAPEFGVTMRELNNAVPDRISDHPPLVVDLPLTGKQTTVKTETGEN